MRAKLLLALAVGLLTAAEAPKETASKDLKKLQGAWKSASLVYNGKDLSAEGKGNFRLVFKGDRATVEGNDAIKKEYARVTFKLDPTTTPPCVDITVTGGVQKDAVIEGIYKLKGDEFTVCAKILGKERPAKFESPEGSSIVLLVLKRDKP
jgi:uncharacterized protein (TIGR03067 family)